jgi:hypothetical protein
LGSITEPKGEVKMLDERPVRRWLRSLALWGGAAAALMAIMAFAGAASAAAASDLNGDRADALGGMWHRLNPQQSQSNPAPEHERLTCHRSDESVVAQSLVGPAWVCRYNKLPEPALNFAWNTTTGRFRGADVTTTWTCPAWFPANVCQNVTQVVEGDFDFSLAGGGGFSVLVDMVVTQTGADQVLYNYWVNLFVCPWFRSFEQALAANPFPLPFDGVNGPAGDCIGAP